MDPKLYTRFDAPFVRTGTESVKWDTLEQQGNADALPMWIADMDFATAPGIIDGLNARTQHGAFGYSMGEDRDRRALINWLAARHECTVTPEDILFCPGVVDALYHTLKALFPAGSRILVQPPVYRPFYMMTEKAGMQVVENPLAETENGWEMDFADLEKKLSSGVSALILCSPHNPVGRIWTRAELEQLVRLCNRYDTLIISDEIHADFELDGHAHSCILSIPGAEDAVQLVSATKTFNLAALRHSAILCREENRRAAIKARLDEVMTDVNLYGRLATRLAYETGAEWLDTLLVYLARGRDILEEGINATGILHASHTQGTYLMWVDCRRPGMDNDELKQWFIRKVGIIPNDGAAFGNVGTGFIRLNFATQHANIREAVKRIQKAVREL